MVRADADAGRALARAGWPARRPRWTTGRNSEQVTLGTAATAAHRAEGRRRYRRRGSARRPRPRPGPGRAAPGLAAGHRGGASAATVTTASRTPIRVTTRPSPSSDRRFAAAGPAVVSADHGHPNGRCGCPTEASCRGTDLARQPDHRVDRGDRFLRLVSTPRRAAEQMATQMLTWLAAHATRLGALPEKWDARGTTGLPRPPAGVDRRPPSCSPLACRRLIHLPVVAHPGGMNAGDRAVLLRGSRSS